MVYTNDRAADVHSSKGRRRKRSRRLRWPLKLFCMCLVLSAVVLTISTLSALPQTRKSIVRSFSAPMSALEPAEQLTEQHPESSLQEPDALPPVELNPAPQSGAVTPDDWQILLVNRWNPLPDGYTFERTKLKYGHSVDSSIPGSAGDDGRLPGSGIGPGDLLVLPDTGQAAGAVRKQAPAFDRRGIFIRKRRHGGWNCGSRTGHQ